DLRPLCTAHFSSCLSRSRPVTWLSNHCTMRGNRLSQIRRDMVTPRMGFQKTGPSRSSPQGSTPLGLLPEGRVLFLTVGQIKRPETERRFPHGRNRGPLTRGQRQTALIRLRPGQQKADDVGSSLQEPTQEDAAWVHLLMPFTVGQDLPKK